MIVRSKLLAVGVLGLLFLLGPSVISATPSICNAVPGNLVLNCGFELGVYSSTIGGSTNPSVPLDWVPSFGYDLEPGFNHITGNANSGAQALSIANDDGQPLATLSQTIADVPGATYNGSFWAYDGGFEGDGNAFFELLVDGNLVTPPGMLFDTVGPVYQEFTFSFIGTGSDTLTFGAQTNPNEWFLDDVTVLGPSPTPEPASLLLMGSGLLGMAGVLRRRLFHA
jgi:hypothetical protein